MTRIIFGWEILKLSILLYTTLLWSHEVRLTRTKGEKPKSSWTMYCGISYTKGLTKEYSSCGDKIIAYENQGFYARWNEFNPALSFGILKLS